MIIFLLETWGISPPLIKCNDCAPLGNSWPGSLLSYLFRQWKNSVASQTNFFAYLSFFLMSLCNCWVAFLTVTLRSRVKGSYGSRDCASRDTDLLRDSQWDPECWVWLRMHTVVGYAHFYMTQVPGHASVNLGCVAAQASEAVGAPSCHSCFALLWLSGKEIMDPQLLLWI